ncbi:MAG TPA: N-acetylmuramoyl-L-alanine amidase [Tissierellaceae bacterium]|nr:N-acetylmuramoyl-L-alanine amidase [Tissierellaceae bacterium]
MAPKIIFFTRKKHLYLISVLIIGIATINILPSEAIKNVISSSKIKPLSKRIIVVDPGHGGIDGGTHYGEILEKDINLAIGLKLRDQLIKKGAKVNMTRERDASLEDYISNGSRHSRDLKARVGIIDASKADIFVSIHVNHIKNVNRMGPIVFYYEKSQKGKSLAEAIQKQLNKLSEYKKEGIEINRIPMTGDYYILKNTKVPGVIIETGFISNQIDRSLLQDEGHQEEIIELIIKGIIAYLNQQ